MVTDAMAALENNISACDGDYEASDKRNPLGWLNLLLVLPILLNIFVRIGAVAWIGAWDLRSGEYVATTFRIDNHPPSPNTSRKILSSSSSCS